MKSKVLLLTLLAGVLIQAAYGQEAIDIIKKADEKMRGASSYGEAVMQIVRPDWTREIGMKMW